MWDWARLTWRYGINLAMTIVNGGPGKALSIRNPKSVNDQTIPIISNLLKPNNTPYMNNRYRSIMANTSATNFSIPSAASLIRRASM